MFMHEKPCLIPILITLVGLVLSGIVVTSRDLAALRSLIGYVYAVRCSLCVVGRVYAVLLVFLGISLLF